MVYGQRAQSTFVIFFIEVFSFVNNFDCGCGTKVCVICLVIFLKIFYIVHNILLSMCFY